MADKPFNIYQLIVHCIKIHSMTLEEIEHKIQVNNTTVAAIHGYINRMVGKHFVNIADLHIKINIYKAENMCLVQTRNRLRKINQLLGK